MAKRARLNLLDDPEVRGAYIAAVFIEDQGLPLGTLWGCNIARQMAADLREGYTPAEVEEHWRFRLGLPRFHARAGEATLCGAEPTEHDVTSGPMERHEVGPFLLVPCPTCRAKLHPVSRRNS